MRSFDQKQIKFGITSGIASTHRAKLERLMEEQLQFRDNIGEAKSISKASGIPKEKLSTGQPLHETRLATAATSYTMF